MAEHREHHKMMIRDFRKRFVVSLIITVPILVFSPLIQEFLGYELTFPGARYVIFGLATAVFLYGGRPFLKGFIDEMKDRSPGMMTLIALAITVAYVYSSAVVFGLEGRYFFWELATLIDVMLLGHWIEMRSIMSASSALEELARLMPDTAHRKKGDRMDDIPLEEVEKGDILVIKPGEKVPSDGTVTGGTSYMDESMLTGESEPVEKNEGDELIGGSVNQDGSLELKVKNTGEDSYLSKVINMVKQSQESKSKTQSLSDRAALWLTIIAIAAGTLTLAGWLVAGRDLQFSIGRMATVMVITCPHALGLAIPLVVAVSTTLSAKNGLLIRNRTAFENSRNVDAVVFDKTGTLTRGTFEVTLVRPVRDGMDEKELMTIAASLEQNSEHPIGKGIVEKAKNDGLSLEQVSDFQAIKGKGAKAVVGGEEYLGVSRSFLEEKNIRVPEEASAKEGIMTMVYMVKKEEVIGIIGLSDVVRDESKEAVSTLKERGIECWMITGDNEDTAKAVADELGISGYFAEVLPDEKREKIKELKEKGKFTLMVGDGVNDAPALAEADVGVAIGSGTDVAAETADIILTENDPRDVVSLISFGRQTFKKMIQNLVWATGYNVAAIPLAAGALAWAGIIISPAIGALLMSASTVIVAINAKFLSFS
ncbi:MAG: copper-translocating P-type ATPase [Spirochaetia bacterium]